MLSKFEGERREDRRGAERSGALAVDQCRCAIAVEIELQAEQHRIDVEVAGRKLVTGVTAKKRDWCCFRKEIFRADRKVGFVGARERGEPRKVDAAVEHEIWGRVELHPAADIKTVRLRAAGKAAALCRKRHGW